MMAAPRAILIGADKGGVGKTTVARTLVDYLTAQGIPLRAFDTEAHKGALYRFHPKITEIVDVTEVLARCASSTQCRSQTSPSLTCAPGCCRRRCTPCAISIEFLDSAKTGQLT